LVGNKTANAWVDDFHGQPAMFVTLELMGAPPYDGMLFSHEAVHLAQGWFQFCFVKSRNGDSAEPRQS
jgi:hypothetical protein